MSQAFKQFADLKSLYADLKARELHKKQEEALRLKRERQLQAEANLFQSSIGAVVPLRPHNRVEPFVVAPLPLALQHLADEQAALHESLSDEFDVESLLDTDQALSYTSSGVGPEVVRKLRRGHWVIQDELDLHGMRRDAARTSLGLFFCGTPGKRGIRCVRIVHGKGLGSVNKEPVLKAMVYRWLVQKEVIAFCVARAADGGAGALVVLLRG